MCVSSSPLAGVVVCGGVCELGWLRRWTLFCFFPGAEGAVVYLDAAGGVKVHRCGGRLLLGNRRHAWLSRSPYRLRTSRGDFRVRSEHSTRALCVPHLVCGKDN